MPIEIVVLEKINSFVLTSSVTSAACYGMGLCNPILKQTSQLQHSTILHLASLRCTMASESFDPKGKGHLLALHILEKGFQAGSIIGGVIICPILAYRFGVRDPNIFIRLANGMAVSALTGTALAGEHARSIRHLFYERF